MRLVGTLFPRGMWVACTALAMHAHAQQATGSQSAQTALHSAGSGSPIEETALYAAPADTPEGVLQGMAGRASVIFTGTVTAVRKVSSSAVVEVDFAVDHAIRGASAGSVYTLREWAGLWCDSPRFVAGQRLLMLLHAPNAGGLASPVDGLDGAIPIKAGSPLNDAPLSALTTNARGAEQQQDAVDLRWLQAKTLRTPAIADAPTSSPGETFAGSFGVTQSLTSSAAAASTAKNQVSATSPLTHVLGLLKAWQGSANASN